MATRAEHTATLLLNGTVLVAGGAVRADGQPLAGAELFDPITESWATTGSMATSRYVHTATRLKNGDVLVAGGFDGSGSLASAELYGAASGTWSTTAGMATGRYVHTATLLSDGDVLVAGGFDGRLSTATAELYHAASPPDIPEAPIAILLAPLGMAAAALVLLLRRSRRAPSPRLTRHA